MTYFMGAVVLRPWGLGAGGDYSPGRDGTDRSSDTHRDGWTDGNSPMFNKTSFPSGLLPKRQGG